MKQTNNWPNKVFEALVIRGTELGEKTDEHSENFNKDLTKIFFKKTVRVE